MSCAGRPLKARHRRGFMDKAKVGKGSSLTSVFQQTEFTLGVIIVALFVITSVCTDNFFSVYNITNLIHSF